MQHTPSCSKTNSVSRVHVHAPNASVRVSAYEWYLLSAGPLVESALQQHTCNALGQKTRHLSVCGWDSRRATPFSTCRRRSCRGRRRAASASRSPASGCLTCPAASTLWQRTSRRALPHRPTAGSRLAGLHPSRAMPAVRSAPSACEQIDCNIGLPRATHLLDPVAGLTIACFGSRTLCQA